MSQYSLPNDLLPAHFNRQEKESPSVSVPILQEDRTQLLLELESQKDSNDHYRNNNHSNGGVARRRRRGAENSYQDYPTANHGEEDTRRHLRAYRSTYYTNRLSYCYLFIFFLIAVGNLSGLFYYWHYTKGKTDDGFRTNRTDDPDGPPPLAEDIQKRKREEREWLVSALQTTMQAHHSKRRQTDETEDVFSVLSQQETLFHSPHAPPSPSGRYFTKGFYKGLSQPEAEKAAALLEGLQLFQDHIRHSPHDTDDLFDANLLDQTNDKYYKSVESYAHCGVRLDFNVKPTTQHQWSLGAVPDRPSLYSYVKAEQRLPEYNSYVYHGLSSLIQREKIHFCVPSDYFTPEEPLPYMEHYAPSLDIACEGYLQDPSAWLSIAPMASDLRSGRTIKFRLYYRQTNTSAVMKLPQKGFLTEPYAEVAAYHVDRLLRYRATPPTVLVEFPVVYLQAAAGSLNSSFYSSWLQGWVLSQGDGEEELPPSRRRGVFKCHSPSVIAHFNAYQRARKGKMDSPDCIHVSLQRWEDHVIPVESSVLGDTAAMTPPQDVSLFQPPFTRYKDLLAQSTSGRNERERTALRERYRTFTFDTIIGNSDRWVGHNLFVLAPAGRPTPRVLFIDQGSGFGQEGLLPCNPFHAASFRAALPTGTGKRGASAPLGRLNPQGTCDPRPPMCVGHRRTLDTLREVVQFSQLYYNTHEVFHHRSPVSVSHYKRFHATLLLNWTAQAPVRGYFQPEHPEEQTLPLFTVADVRNAALSSEESTKVGRSLAFLLSLRLPPQVLTVLTEDMIEAAGRRVWAVLAQDQRCAHQYPLLQNTF